MIARGEEQRHKQEDERTNHQIETRAEHVIHFAHVIGGARHGIADRLEVVEGHALAKQGDVQLVAHIALDTLGHELGAKIPPQLENAAYYLRSAHEKGQREQNFRLRWKLEHGVYGIAGQHRDVGSQGGIADSADEHDQHQPPVTQGVRDHPTKMATPIRIMTTVECEFCN